MDKNRSELFGHFSYDDDLTYEDLLEVEEALTAAMTNLLLRAGASHLDFTPQGDALMFQCVFEAHKLYIYRKIAFETATLLPEGVRGRLLCLDKDFNSLHIYWLRTGQWQEEERSVPFEPPQGLKTWKTGGAADMSAPPASPLPRDKE
ncbi:MAG: hypothetical protein RBR41_10580 [Desulfovibrio sp.]|uniref:hypothetical protein n=1 Tax=Desulfovibrio sp. TaxID=885 RepID=UPI002A36B1E0|nr:hypothetical protein [Desulfovibrio sp.]MDY0260094.1 hypothetical protein [Desulfovibrio sp.]